MASDQLGSEVAVYLQQHVITSVTLFGCVKKFGVL